MRFLKDVGFFSRITRTRIILCAGLLIVLIAAGAFWSYGNMSLRPRSSGAAGFDIASPDAFILTKGLARLPRDIIRVPLLKEVLTEDFVFYYEQNEGRFSLDGTLRRIAYEHELDLKDWLIRTVMDEPAEVALWKGPHGRLSHFLVAMSRNRIARVSEMAAKAALNDKQLQKVEEDLIVDGSPVPVFALSYSHKSTLFFAARGDRMVILSDMDMLSDGDGKIAKQSRQILSKLLAGDPRARRVYQERLGIGETDATHTVVATVRYLSFGYQHFFPALQAIRFDFESGGWSTRMMADASKLTGATALWKTIPTNPVVCAALPVDWKASAGFLKQFGAGEEQIGRVLAAVDGPVAASWYAKSRLHTPLFVVPLKAPLGASEADLLSRVFHEIIGGAEPALKVKGGDRFPVKMSRLKGGATLWQRDVTSRYGTRTWMEPEESLGREGGYFRVTLALNHKALYFSPDSALIDDALAVADKMYPALEDSLPEGSRVLAVISPASLAALVQMEALASLPAGDEPVFRNVANERLLPKLAALKKYPAYGLVLPARTGLVSGKWLPVTWQALNIQK